ncbi:MAG: heparinase II/III family protein, partial [Pseudomonadota bacterium]
NGNEIVRDYGAARFLNIEAKRGGRYLPENTTWAKTTIAHNTLVVDERSHFDGNVKVANERWPRQLYFDDTPELQVSSARIDVAYGGVSIRRTLVMPTIPGLEAPLVLDLVHASSDTSHQYDLPLHYSGHVMEFDFEATHHTSTRPVLGSANGYQHIWVDAEGALEDGQGALTWILDGRFYTYRFAGNGPLTAILGESGASDPEFNLRREPLIIVRANREGDAHFASLLEAHGSYDGAAEQTLQSRSAVKDLQHDRADGMDIVRLTLKSEQRFAITLSHDPDPQRMHSVAIDGESLEWSGFAAVIPLSGEES